jgi:hypothetical protein
LHSTLRAFIASPALTPTVISGDISEAVIDDREMEIAKNLQSLMLAEEESAERNRRAQAEKDRLEAREMMKREREERERLDLLATMEMLRKEQEERDRREERERLDLLAVREMLKKEKEEHDRHDLLAAKVLFPAYFRFTLFWKTLTHQLQALGERLDREEAEQRRMRKQMEVEQRQAAAAAAREKAAQEAAVAAAKRLCGVCQDAECDVADCVHCSAGHIVCKTCFALQITHQTGADLRDVFVRNGCNITCEFCQVPFREREFVRV